MHTVLRQGPGQYLSYKRSTKTLAIKRISSYTVYMKRKILTILLVTLCIVCFVSCGASWKAGVKTFKSSVGDGLNRHVEVYDARTGKTLWQYDGICSISDASSTGDFVVMYYTNEGEPMKADFMGRYISLFSYEY